MNTKGAIQLSMDFIVTILIGLALLGIGMVLLRSFLAGTEDIKVELDQQSEEQIAALLDRGQQVAVPFSTQNIDRGNHHIFGVGVLNIQDPGSFNVQVTFVKAVDKNNNVITTAGLNIDSWLRYDDTSFRLEKNERRSIPVLIAVPNLNAPSATYIFNVQVTRNSDSYDNIKKIYVIVP